MRESRKYPISRDKFKQLIEPIINKELKKSGRPSKVSHYNFFCGALYVLRTGIPWRDLPAEYGNWHTIYTRYKRWSENGFFWKLLYQLQSIKRLLMDVIFIDGSIIPLHRHGGGALKKEGGAITRQG
jgi:transposase